MRRPRVIFVVLIALILMVPPALNACTGIILRTLDGITLIGRTMEFGFDIKSDILVVPAGTKFTTLDGNPEKSGFTFEAKYGFAGANAIGRPVIVDGVNEKGLYFGAFYFLGPAKYAELTSANQKKAISSEELGNWLLSQFATVAEIKAALPGIVVVGTEIKEIGGIAPLHYAVTDATGAAIVIEYTQTGLRIHDNTVNAVTNNPTYDWHLTNLRKYIGLSAVNRETVKVGQQELKPFGQGTGMFGLPGDFSSPSRFVRATAFANHALPSANANEGVFRAFHIMNNFDIPKGAIRESDSNTLMDYTVWTSVTDTKNAVYYYKTFKTQAVERLDVRKALVDLKSPKIIKMKTEFSVTDRTDEVRQ
ncbi:MAG: choloylglycine hydrolase family protein [Pirellulaceae bacterium]|nr:choloylglycine hydrolase family protein [Pirellulaceae bacterium]MDG2103051.1 choloylglycine hydrolase family protein [Pirellulaceae bacterium]